MSDTAKIAKNLERFRQGVFAHDRENPGHKAWGIGLAYYDLFRLGFEEDEELWPGIIVCADGGQSGNFRVLCDGDEDTCKEAEQEVTRAVGREVHA